MDYFLLIVVFLQFAFIVYQDFSNRRERKDLQLKLMSKDVHEYKEVTRPTPKDTPKKEENYMDPMEVDAEKILSAEDNT